MKSTLMSEELNYFFNHVGFHLLSEMKTRAPLPGETCHVCMRDISDCNPSNYAIDFEAYGIDNVHCACCHSLFQGSLTKLGIERGASVPIKLGMLTGCGMVITPKKVTIYANKGFYNKLIKAPNCPFDIVELSGKDFKTFLLNTPPKANRFLVITNFGRKKVGLLRSLKFSSKDEIFMCEEGGVVSIAPKLWGEILKTTEDLPKKLVNSWFDILKKLSTGMIAPVDELVVSFWAENPKLQKLSNKFPVDPHQRMDLVSLIKSY